MRTIDTGRGVSRTALSSVEIAELRPTEDPQLFMDTFARVRTIAPSLANLPLDLEMICTEFTRHSSVMEAAMIEALASLRAEGARL